MKRPDTLSFIKPRATGGLDHWADVAAGASYTDDCEIGERLAREFIAFIAEDGTIGGTALLGPIMLDMEENGATRGQKIGFMNTVNRYAMIGGAVGTLAGLLAET